MDFDGSLTYSTSLSDGTLLEMFPGGKSTIVPYRHRLLFAQWLQYVHETEAWQQTQAVKLGVSEVGFGLGRIALVSSAQALFWLVEPCRGDALDHG